MTDPAEEPIDPRAITRPQPHQSGGEQDDTQSPFELSTGHILFKCRCTKSACQFCDGGLSACIVCGGFEGSLTTECCGRQITEEEEKRIYHDADLDYRGGAWVNAPNYPRSKDHKSNRTFSPGIPLGEQPNQ